eukprot:CAMPEP_0198654352 /NCGR_PEP_ID=MMETSP1467-20131203/7657_1 /TAXON_ID=1462469 /ORGANISM="unid. sp., Strain CCMP2135" /LENGTH=64 /DNA_ID=CAMNT_0044390337 /DNA_START=39 /DNA_END=230 /DNA_ORIENTATION=-
MADDGVSALELVGLEVGDGGVGVEGMLDALGVGVEAPLGCGSVAATREEGEVGGGGAGGEVRAE